MIRELCHLFLWGFTKRLEKGYGIKVIADENTLMELYIIPFICYTLYIYSIV